MYRVSLLHLSTILLIQFCLLSGCSSTHSTSPLASAGPGAGQAQFPALADLPDRAPAVYETEGWAPYLASEGYDHQQLNTAGPGQTVWAIYGFGPFSDAFPLPEFELGLKGSAGPLWVGLSDYGAGSWSWVEVSGPYDVPAAIALPGAGPYFSPQSARAYILLAAYDGSTLKFNGTEVLPRSDKVYRGSYTVSSRKDINALEGYTAVSGNLTITGDELAGIMGLEAIEYIGGDLAVRDISALDNLNGLHGLQLVGSDVIIDNCDSLTQIDGLSALQAVYRSVTMTDTPALEAIRLPSLELALEGFSVTKAQSLTLIDLPAAHTLGSLEYVYSRMTPVLESVSAPQLRVVRGDLTISGPSRLTELQFPKLEVVQGSLYVTCSLLSGLRHFRLENISFPMLSRVGYRMSFSGLDAAEALELPALEAVQDDIKFERSDSIRTLSLDKLQECRIILFSRMDALEHLDLPLLEQTYNFRMEYCDLLVRVDLPRLQKCVTGIFFHGNDGVAILCAPQLQQIDQSLTLGFCSSLESIYMPKLWRIGSNMTLEFLDSLQDVKLGLTQFADRVDPPATGTISINYCDSLINLDGLGHLPRAQYVRIVGNAKLRSLLGLQIDEIGTVSSSPQAGLYIKSNPELWHIGSLGVTSLVGDIVLENNSELSELDGLSQLESVDGSLTINDCPALIGFAGLEALRTVTQGVTISNCASLKNLNALSGLAHITTKTGDLTLIDNARLHDIFGLANLQVNEGWGYVIRGDLTVTGNALWSGDQDAWDVVEAWGGEDLVEGVITIENN